MSQLSGHSATFVDKTHSCSHRPDELGSCVNFSSLVFFFLREKEMNKVSEKRETDPFQLKAIASALATVIPDDVTSRGHFAVDATTSTALQQRQRERLSSAARKRSAPSAKPCSTGSLTNFWELPARSRPRQLPQKSHGLPRDHLPPVSQASTTRRARPWSPESSGYRSSLVRLAWSNAAPSRPSHYLRGAPSARTTLTIVVSMAN